MFIIPIILGAALVLAPYSPLIGAVGAGAGVYGDYQRMQHRFVTRREYASMNRDIARLKYEVTMLRFQLRNQHGR